MPVTWCAQRQRGVADREQGGTDADVIGPVRVGQELAAVGDDEDVIAARGQARHGGRQGLRVAGPARNDALMRHPAQEHGRVVERVGERKVDRVGPAW